MKIQITLFSNAGYKPVSCIIEAENITAENKKELQNRGIIKICQKRYWQKFHLKQYGYTKVKIREYDKEKIEAENKARYEQIKKERGWIKEEG